MNENANLHVRMSAPERMAVTEIATARGMSVSDLVRGWVSSGCPDGSTPPRGCAIVRCIDLNALDRLRETLLAVREHARELARAVRDEDHDGATRLLQMLQSMVDHRLAKDGLQTGHFTPAGATTSSDPAPPG